MDYSQLPLRDIHLPATVGWWPPAPGWWILALLALVCCSVAAVWHYRRRGIRAALRGIRKVLAALDAGEGPVLCMQRLSILLRRFAMTHDAHAVANVAGLTGTQWLDYLDSRWDQDAFGRQGTLLIVAPYARADKVSREQVGELARLCRDWVRAQK